MREQQTLGRRIQEARKAAGLSQESLGERLGVSRQAVSKWETGTADPTTSNLLALAKLFGVPAEELLRETRGELGELSLAIAEKVIHVSLNSSSEVVARMIQVATEGIKSVVSAMLILSMAYCINAISKTLGTSSYVISVTESWMTPVTLLALAFAVCAFMAFFTGTSWGVYAIMIPIVMPLAFNMTGGEATNLVYATIAAVMGGGCFGDHCSPLSDTTILSSLGAGSDHVDHVKTQLPYALTVAVITCIGYIIIGLCLK